MLAEDKGGGELFGFGGEVLASLGGVNAREVNPVGGQTWTLLESIILDGQPSQPPFQVTGMETEGPTGLRSYFSWFLASILLAWTSPLVSAQSESTSGPIYVTSRSGAETCCSPADLVRNRNLLTRLRDLLAEPFAEKLSTLQGLSTWELSLTGFTAEAEVDLPWYLGTDGNPSAVATVPATYTISEGFQGQIQAAGANDPDDTQALRMGSSFLPSPSPGSSSRRYCGGACWYPGTAAGAHCFFLLSGDPGTGSLSGQKGSLPDLGRVGGELRLLEERYSMDPLAELLGSETYER